MQAHIAVYLTKDEKRIISLVAKLNRLPLSTWCAKMLIEHAEKEWKSYESSYVGFQSPEVSVEMKWLKQRLKDGNGR